MRISTVVISVGSETRFYRSAAEVPTALRTRLTEATSGAGAMTLLIADEAGRRELLRSANGESAMVESRLIRSLTGGTQEEQGAPIWPRSPRLRLWAEIGLLGAVGVSLWLLARLS
jgi:hypothetical protein